MSWNLFKNNMILFMDNPGNIESSDDFAKKLTSEYDLLIRRGLQSVNNVPIATANTQQMESLIKIAGMVALNKTDDYDIINQLGMGITMYWTGATLGLLPVPITPAMGSFQNIVTTSANITNPGEFPDFGNQYPTDTSEQFIDLLINAMTLHLYTVEGVYNTVSMYPGFPTVPPAPGIVNWTGFTIPE